MRVLYLSNRVPWFGAHTGYEQLPQDLEKGIPAETLSPQAGVLSRALGKALSVMRGHGRISQADAAARWRLERKLIRDDQAVGHLLYGEEHLPFWRDAAARARRRSILTLHQPRSQWKEAKAEALAGCPHTIVLWQKEIDWFKERLKGGEVHFVPHGVDIHFFSPGPESPAPAHAPMRILYVGVHLRNTAMLGRIVQRLSQNWPEIEFDFLVPAHRRNESELAKLAQNPKVHWHGNVGDEQLRELYRRARLLLLPLENSGANTAVVEALACGLPLVTTDVGGIRDYGGGTIFPVVENNDDEGMLAMTERYLSDPAERARISLASRTFAEQELAWPLIAQRHVEIYRKVLA